MPSEMSFIGPALNFLLIIVRQEMDSNYLAFDQHRGILIVVVPFIGNVQCDDGDNSSDLRSLASRVVLQIKTIR